MFGKEILAEAIKVIARKNRCPVIGLRVEEIGQGQQVGVAIPVVKPQDHIQFVSGAGLSPGVERLRWQRQPHVIEIIAQHRRDPWIAGGFIIVLQRVRRRHARPPVIVLRGP